MEQQQPNQEAQGKQINPEHVINSLSAQIADISKKSAQKDAVIIELNQQVMELKKDNENLREALKDNERGDKNEKQ